MPGALSVLRAGVARGYLNRPELTQQHFVTDPFSKGKDPRMYHTGDVVRCREDGLFEYLGRLDDQLKIRGYRVELGEVESVVSEHPAVRHCVAMAREDEPGNKQLTAHVVLRAAQEPTTQELREFVRRKLPEYMVPSHLVFLEGFPLTANGKVDRHALPVPEKTGSRTELIPPANDVESSLAAIWSELLGINPLSVTDNFFDLGGHSLLLAKLLLKINISFNKELSTATLFEAPTIKELALVLEGNTPSASIVIPLQQNGDLPPFFCVGAGPLFRTLARRLGTARPFLGLSATQLPVLRQASTVPDLEQIAADLVTVILDYQKKGPYFLSGWSASGVLAYETAGQLVERGCKVDLLVMFDTQNPQFRESLQKQTRLNWWAQKIHFLGKELWRLRPATASAFFGEKVRELQRKIEVVTWPIRNKILMRLNPNTLPDTGQMVYAAARAYRPSAYPARVIFFKPIDRPLGDASDLSLGWRHLVLGGFDVREVSGDHRSMFQEPHVEWLAAKMREHWL